MRQRIPFVLVALLLLPLAGCGDSDPAGTVASKPTPPAPQPEPAGPGPLAQALQKKADASAAKIPEDVMALFQRAAQELQESGLVAKALNVGGKAPAFELKDPLGQSVTLAKRLKRGPVVLAFYRGKW